MTKKTKTLAIIPARGGSKGVPKKNSLKFDGKPLIQYALDCALDSKRIDKIIVNSEDTEILNLVDDTLDRNRIIKQLRPTNLAEDNSSICDVILHALENIKEKYDILILLQVTSPLRKAQDIENILNFFEENSDLDGVISVVQVNDNHPARMYTLDESKTLSALNNDFETTHRQGLSKVFLRNGCFYAIRTEAFFEQKTLMPKHKKAYVMNPEHLLNIDSPRDVVIAEALIKAWKEERI